MYDSRNRPSRQYRNPWLAIGVLPLVAVLAWSYGNMGRSAEDQYGAALVAIEEGDYEAAHTILLQSAKDGDPRAMFRVGALYRAGLGVDENATEAGLWYLRAAEAGHAPAQFDLAVMHQKGEGVPLDLMAAADWYRAAGTQNFGQAQFNLAVLYQLGLGLPQDPVEAFIWFGRAALQNVYGARQRMDTVSQIMSPEQLEDAMKILNKEAELTE